MPKNVPAGKQFAVYLTDEVHTAIEEIAMRYGISRSELVRTGIVTWLKAMQAHDSQMCLVAIPANVAERLRARNMIGAEIIPNVLAPVKASSK